MGDVEMGASGGKVAGEIYSDDPHAYIKCNVGPENVNFLGHVCEGLMLVEANSNNVIVTPVGEKKPDGYKSIDEASMKKFFETKMGPDVCILESSQSNESERFEDHEFYTCRSKDLSELSYFETAVMGFMVFGMFSVAVGIFLALNDRDIHGGPDNTKGPGSPKNQVGPQFMREIETRPVSEPTDDEILDEGETPVIETVLVIGLAGLATGLSIALTPVEAAVSFATTMSGQDSFTEQYPSDL